MIEIKGEVSLRLGPQPDWLQRLLCSSQVTVSGTCTNAPAPDMVHDLTAVFPAKQVWEFPQDRFVSYEASDEDWCRYFGIGREIEIKPTLHMPQARLKSFDGEIATFVGVCDSAPEYSHVSDRMVEPFDLDDDSDFLDRGTDYEELVNEAIEERQKCEAMAREFNWPWEFYDPLANLEPSDLAALVDAAAERAQKNVTPLANWDEFIEKIKRDLSGNKGVGTRDTI